MGFMCGPLRPALNDQYSMAHTKVLLFSEPITNRVIDKVGPGLLAAVLWLRKLGSLWARLQNGAKNMSPRRTSLSSLKTTNL